jgi:ribosome recycling factor
MAARMTEDGKVGIRNVRQDYKKKIDLAKSQKEISEDEAK